MHPPYQAELSPRWHPGYTRRKGAKLDRAASADRRRVRGAGTHVSAMPVVDSVDAAAGRQLLHSSVPVLLRRPATLQARGAIADTASCRSLGDSSRAVLSLLQARMVPGPPEVVRGREEQESCNGRTGRGGGCDCSCATRPRTCTLRENIRPAEPRSNVAPVGMTPRGATRQARRLAHSQTRQRRRLPVALSLGMLGFNYFKQNSNRGAPACAALGGCALALGFISTTGVSSYTHKRTHAQEQPTPPKQPRNPPRASPPPSLATMSVPATHHIASHSAIVSRMALRWFLSRSSE